MTGKRRAIFVDRDGTLSNFTGYQVAEFYTVMDMQENIRPAIVQNHL